jgi:hypothetical protein
MHLMSGLLVALAGSEVVMPLILSTVRSNKGKNVADSIAHRISRRILVFRAFFQGAGIFPG